MTTTPTPVNPQSGNGFAHLVVAGSPRERGLAYGIGLADRIRQLVAFYRVVFAQPATQVAALADGFRTAIRAFAPDYATEIEAIAEGAGMDPLDVYALNARTEIMALAPPECTAVWFRKTRLLAQNWDFAPALEPLAVILTVVPDHGPRFTMLTEPGIIGKIGLNEAGVGVCLNLLTTPGTPSGVPIHVLLRSVLDSPSLADARRTLAIAGPGTSSNLLAADAAGQCFDLEYRSPQVLELPCDGDSVVHTNHYLAGPATTPALPRQSTHVRFDTACACAARAPQQSLPDMVALLSDQSDTRWPICRPYPEGRQAKRVGTVATMIMDLQARRLLVRRGPHPAGPFTAYLPANTDRPPHSRSQRTW